MKTLKYSYLFLISLSLLVLGCSDNSTGSKKTKTFEVHLTPNPPKGGAVSPQSKTVRKKGDLDITADAAEGYIFSGWSSNGNFSSEQSSSTVTVISDIGITANFDKTKYNLTTKTEGKGEISEAIVNNKQKEYKRGTKVKLTAKPNDGWEFTKWKGPVERKENNIGQVTLDKDKTVTAVFSKQDIVGLVSSTDQLSKLAEAVQHTELVETLQGDGPFTLFAPNNDAFSEYLNNNSFGNIRDIPPKILKEVLQYHIVAGKKLEVDNLNDGSQKVETVQGNMLTVKKSDNKVTLTDQSGNTYMIMAADNMASNGIVHIINGVLSPKSQANPDGGGGGNNQLQIFDKTNWTVHDFSSQDTDHGQFAKNVIDGDGSTLWQGNFGDNKQPLPHSVSINMGQSYQIHGLKINPKHSNAKSLPTQIKVEFSDDGNSWGNSTTFSNPFTYSENDFKIPRLELPEPVEAQYFRVIIQKDAGDVPVTGLNEVDAYGKLPLLDRTSWTIHDFSSQDTDHGQFAKNVIDGDGSTLWQGNFGDNKQPLPHSVSINMGQSYQIHGLKINPKHSNAKSLPTQIKVEFSDDGNSWDNSTTFSNPFTYSENDFKIPRLELPEPVEAQYFRVMIQKDAGNVPVTGLNEVEGY